MPTIIDRLLGRAPTEKAIVTGSGGTGAGVLAYLTDVPLWSAARNPRKLMRQAQVLYHEHPWVHAAEHRVSSTAAGVLWHLEDENDDEVTDESPAELKAIRDLLDHPQANVPLRIAKMTRRAMWQITLRHLGMCGDAFWYKDQREGLTGTPAAFLYINPARMLDVQDRAGNLIGWKLDADDAGEGGIPLELEEIVHFQYDPPDWGHRGVGIVESAGLKAQLTQLADRHQGNVLGSGGRLTGVFTPKEGGATMTEDNWASFVRDWRNVAEDPNAAKRAIIAKQPLDHIRTSATPTELAIVEVAKMGREDVFALWGVPLSQQGIATAVGMNSGDTKGYDEAVLWQGPVHSRLQPFKETIQYLVLDEIARRGGPRTELVIEEPEFDDETPLFERAKAAIDQPLTDNQRLAILGLDPLPDYDLDGNPLGVAIYRPINLVLAAAGPGEDGNLKRLPEEPEPALPPLPEFGEGEVPSPPPPPAKAALQPLKGLRQRLDTHFAPAIRRAVGAYLRNQAKAVAARVREHGDKVARKPRDWGVWWDPKVVDAALAKVLLPHASAIATQVAEQARQAFAPAKADFEDTVAERIRVSTGLRISAINETTRDAIAALIAEGFAEGLAPAEVASRIAEAAVFDEARAELIARTESALVYNEAALTSYGEFGVTEVLAIDGDQDPECAERNGNVYPVEEAMSITDHPNGTLDWSPVVAPTGT